MIGCSSIRAEIAGLRPGSSTCWAPRSGVAALSVVLDNAAEVARQSLPTRGGPRTFAANGRKEGSSSSSSRSSSSSSRSRSGVGIGVVVVAEW